MYKGFLVYYENHSAELEKSRTAICKSEAGYFNNGPVDTEGFLRGSEWNIKPFFDYDDISRLLIEKRFLYLEELAGPESNYDYGFRQNIEGNRSKYFRYYLSEDGDDDCYPLDIEAVNHGKYGYQVTVPEGLCIAAIRTDVSVAPYFLEEKIKMKSKGGLNGFYYRLREVKTGKTIAEFRDLILAKGSTKAPTIACSDHQNRRIEANEEMRAVGEALQALNTTSFLDEKGLSSNSLVREFYRQPIQEKAASNSQ